MSEIKVTIRRHIVRLTQAEAEIRFLVSCAVKGADVHVRGRLMGPRCPYASTVEVAYPLKEIERTTESGGETSILLKTMIPEPSMWDPQSPMLYTGPLGIWQKDQMLEQQTLQMGFVGWGLGTRGLRVNGKYLDLQATHIDSLQADEAAALRARNVNCIVVDLAQAPSSTWDYADRYGFFVLGRISQVEQWEKARAFEGRPSCLGWILNREALAGLKPRGIEGTSYTGSSPLIGLEAGRLTEPVPPVISFLVASADQLNQRQERGLPWLRLEQAGDESKDMDMVEGILGTLRNWPPIGEVKL